MSKAAFDKIAEGLREAVAIACGDECGLCIMTERGWRQIGGPMAPVPPHSKWWNFPAAASYDAQFSGPDQTRAA